jgi:hypothetical protein
VRGSQKLLDQGVPSAASVAACTVADAEIGAPVNGGNSTSGTGTQKNPAPLALSDTVRRPSHTAAHWVLYLVFGGSAKSSSMPRAS